MGLVRKGADVLALLMREGEFSKGNRMFYSKVCNHVHSHALNAEVVGKRERGNGMMT